MPAVADTYTGPIRIYDLNGNLLTLGTASLHSDSDRATWEGTLSVLDGTGVAGKALTVRLAPPQAEPSDAQLRPLTVSGEIATSKVVGLGPQPF